MCSQIKSDHQTWFYCTKLTWCMLLKGKTIIWLMIYGFLTKSWKVRIFAGGFLVTIIFGNGLSLAQISKKWMTMLIWFSQRCDNRWSAFQIWLIYLNVVVAHTAISISKSDPYQILSSVYGSHITNPLLAGYFVLRTTVTCIGTNNSNVPW